MSLGELWTSYKNEEQCFRSLHVDAANRLMTDNNISSDAVTAAASDLQDVFRTRPWLRDTEYKGVDFDNIVNCCAYLKRYAACHSALQRYAAVRLFREIHPAVLVKLLNRDSLEVVSLGGGPGNDLIGMCSAIFTRPRIFENLRLTVVDVKSGWSKVFETIVNQVATHEYGDVSLLYDDLEPTTAFIQSDVTGRKCLDAVRYADIILMTKVLSVIHPSKRTSILRRLFLSMKPGAVFLYVDINSEHVLEAAANHPMNMLLHHPLEYFNLSVESLPHMIQRSSYEICSVQKAFRAPMNHQIQNDFRFLNIENKQLTLANYVRRRVPCTSLWGE